jgi:hypothetical protein
MFLSKPDRLDASIGIGELCGVREYLMLALCLKEVTGTSSSTEENASDAERQSDVKALSERPSTCGRIGEKKY